MICPSCKKNKAQYDEYYGWLPCDECMQRQRKLKRPGGQSEFIPQRIKDDRKEHYEDSLQPHRKGQLSKEYVDRWGTKRLGGYSKQEIKQAKNVWLGDETYYKDKL